VTTRPKFHEFESVAPDPFFWWNKAQDFFAAGEALLEAWRATKIHYIGGLPGANGWADLTQEQQQAAFRIRFPQIFLFLIGLALENLLKGLLVARDGSLVSEGRLSSEVANHKLSSLFQRAGITLSPEQRAFVERLSESVTWAGRYPVPKSEDKFGLPQLPSGAYYLPGTFFEDDEVKAQEIWETVVMVINSESSLRKAKLRAANPAPAADG
jgi:hypothetical protein